MNLCCIRRDLNEYVNYTDKIVNITSLDSSLLILFSNGIFIHFKLIDGEIISHKNMMHDIFPQELHVKRSNRFSMVESI